MRADLQANKGETSCFSLYQRKGLEDGGIIFTLGALEVSEIRKVLGMKVGELCKGEPLHQRLSK